MTLPTTPRDPIVFFGTDAFSVPSLVGLIAGKWNVVAAVTKPDSPTGRGRVLTAPAIKRLAMASNIPVFQPEKLSDIESELARLGPSIGIVVAYGKIIPSSMLNLFPKKLVNVHASLLPRYRGASPIEAAILHGDSETGVTLMELEAGLDTGPTYEVSKLQLSGTETREDLYEHLADMGADLLISQLGAILKGQIVPIPQNAAEASEVSLITKAQGIIDWSKPADILEREVRAYYGWPGTRTQLAGVDLTVTAAHTEQASGPAGTPYISEKGELGVYAGIGSLIIDRVKPSGKREMPGRDFLAGHHL